jgi:alkylated DNA repair protein alkB family protein 6
VLLNCYESGQGIFPHKDGPLYYPRVCILSLGSHTTMHFYRTLADAVCEKQEDPDSHRPVCSVYLPPRSLFIFTEELYTDYFHAIQEVTEDRLQAGVAGVPVELQGQAVPRTQRISLTIRRVPTQAERQQILAQAERPQN